MGPVQKPPLTSFLFPWAHFLSCAAHSISPPFSPCVFPSVSGPEQTLGPGCPPPEWWPAVAPAEAPKDGDLHRGYGRPIPRAASPGTRPLLVPSCPETRTGENTAVGPALPPHPQPPSGQDSSEGQIFLFQRRGKSLAWGVQRPRFQAGSRCVTSHKSPPFLVLKVFTR